MDTLRDERLTIESNVPRRDLMLVYRLALADFLHDRRLSLPLVISLAAVLAPLLVLFGLKFGIVSTMTQELKEDPRARELRPVGQGRFGDEWFAELQAREDVAFLIPTTRYLAATIQLRNRAELRREPVRVELTPSSPADPLLEGIAVQPDGFSSLILSAPAAEALGAEVGDTIQGRISRTLQSGERESVSLDLRVDAVLAAARTDRLEAFVSLSFLIAAENYREGFAAKSLGADGQVRPQRERFFASFRLYARTIADVAGLRQWLAERGVNSDTRLAEIQLIQRLDRNLGLLFAVVASLGGGGYLISLTVSLWANTERKRRELSVLRLVGLRSIALAMFPAMQALFTAALGVLLAMLIYLPVERLINLLFKDSLTEHQVLGRLELQHLAVAAVTTLGFALVASLAASARSARVTPAEGLRDE